MEFQIKQFKKVLVANRGEIAIRIFRALSELGIRTVGIYSKEDKLSLFRTKADESYLVGENKGPIDAYLDMDGIIKIAKASHCDAIHPGYGFLSENPIFADLCRTNGIEFIGPSSTSMNMMGDKISSKKIADMCNVPTIKGTKNALTSSEEALKVAIEIGYPVILKAANGGGGRGMRIVHSPELMDVEFKNAMNESIKSFGDNQIFMEKYLRKPKHIEVQILGDRYGNIVHLHERDCSLQRRHQKVVEFAPSLSLSQKTKDAIFSSALKLAREVKYENAGTLEFLVDENEDYFFIEMNPRIQVEHTVTEMITGIDLVQSQILVAMGYPLDSREINIKSQNDIKVNGFSIQCRVTTEDPTKNFMPDTGRISVYRSSAGFGVRLDGGNAFTGAEITPYYDSLLVKTTSWDRSFEGATKKMMRALREFRIRGIKTNISFLINVINHNTFKEGNCYTSFIEETSELFDIKSSKDRASKLINFIGNVTINENKNNEIPTIDYRIPSFELSHNLVGSKDLLNKLGANEFTQRIKDSKKLYITDTTMRDAHQSLLATRLRTYDLEKIAPYCNEVFKDQFSMETWGGATFDVAYRFLKESPWVRLEKLQKLMPNILQQMLLRASNAVGYKNYPDNVVTEFINVAAERGIDVFRIFDSLNWVENMKKPIETALNTGKIVEGAICYTSDILDPNNTKYTLDYYVKKAKELESLGVHVLGIKDMSGLVKPYAALKLFATLKKELDIPVHFHTHDSTGNGVSSVLMAADAGVDIVDLAIESMSGITSQPSLNSVVEALKNTERDTRIEVDKLNKISEYFSDVRSLYSKYEPDLKTPSVEIYKYEIPGGQYSNLIPQIESLGLGEKIQEVKEAYKVANDLLGNIIKVTPSSKIVGDMAIFMVKNGLTAENILDKGKELSFPESVIDYFKGLIGQPEGGFPDDLQKVVLKGETPITCRPGELLPDEDFKKITTYLRENYTKNINSRNAVSYAMYPKVYEEYCKHLELYNDISKLPSKNFFYGMSVGEEVEVEIESGKSITIKYTGMSEADETGIRTLYFDVNGSPRETEILDLSVEVKRDNKRKAEPKNIKHVASPIPGTVAGIFVKTGDHVTINQPLFTIEAMKMETTVLSKIDGTIDEIFISLGEKISDDELTLILK